MLSKVDHKKAQLSGEQFLRDVLSSFTALHALADELANDDELCDEFDMISDPPAKWSDLPKRIHSQKTCNIFLSVFREVADQLLKALDGDHYEDDEMADTLAEIHGRLDCNPGDDAAEIAQTLDDAQMMLKDLIEEHYT